MIKLLEMDPFDLKPCDPPHKPHSIDGLAEVHLHGREPTLPYVFVHKVRRDGYYVIQGHHRTGLAAIQGKTIRAIPINTYSDLAEAYRLADTGEIPAFDTASRLNGIDRKIAHVAKEAPEFHRRLKDDYRISTFHNFVEWMRDGEYVDYSSQPIVRKTHYVVLPILLQVGQLNHPVIYQEISPAQFVHDLVPNLVGGFLRPWAESSTYLISAVEGAAILCLESGLRKFRDRTDIMDCEPLLQEGFASFHYSDFVVDCVGASAILADHVRNSRIKDVFFQKFIGTLASQYQDALLKRYIDATHRSNIGNAKLP